MGRFLIICASIEETIGSIYRYFVESVPCNDTLKAIWKKMAEEEDQHAIEIRFASRLPESDTVEGELLPRQKAEQLLNKAEAILEGLKRRVPEEQEAVRLSLRLEDEFLQVHIASAVEFKNTKLKDMFNKIASDEESHVRDLKNYYSKHF